MTQYYIYDPITFRYLKTNVYEVQPANSTSIVPIIDVEIAKWNGSEWIDGRTSAEILEQRKEQTKKKYEFHKQNGWNAYQDFRSNIVLQVEDNVLTLEQAFLIEDYLSVGYDKIAQNGDWKVGLYKLNQIILPVEHSFVQSYLDNAIGILYNYIQTNYES